MAVTKELHGKLSSTLITWRQVESINCVWRLQVQMSPNYRLGFSIKKKEKLLFVVSPVNHEFVLSAFTLCSICLTHPMMFFGLEFKRLE